MTSTQFYGAISARGGANFGNGGFVETSGHVLDFSGTVNTLAPNGLAGTLLLDPTNINVVTSGGSAYAAGTNNLFASAGTTTKITPASLNAAASTVVLQATQDITVTNSVNLTTAGAGFVAQAGRNININASVTTNNGPIHLEADSPHSTSGGGDKVGQLNIAAPVTSNGGPITLIAGGDASSSPAKSISNGDGFILVGGVNAGAGGINLALSNNTSELGIGVTGTITQLLGNSTTTPAYGSIGNLATTGTLVIGTATTAGSDGLGTGAQCT